MFSLFHTRVTLSPAVSLSLSSKSLPPPTEGLLEQVACGRLLLRSARWPAGGCLPVCVHSCECRARVLMLMCEEACPSMRVLIVVHKHLFACVCALLFCCDPQ